MATATILPAGIAEEDDSHLKCREEMLAIFHAAREEVRAANPEGRDLLEELFKERLIEAANE